MSFLTNLQNAFGAVGVDVKQLRVWMTGSSTGDLTGLNTAAKGNLVVAINEVNAKPSSAAPAATENTAGIVQLATSTETATGTEPGKAVTPLHLKEATDKVRNDLLGGADGAFNTLKKLETEFQTDESQATALAALVATKANTADVYTKTDIGDITTDLVGVYNAAKA